MTALPSPLRSDIINPFVIFFYFEMWGRGFSPAFALGLSTVQTAAHGAFVRLSRSGFMKCLVSFKPAHGSIAPTVNLPSLLIGVSLLKAGKCVLDWAVLSPGWCWTGCLNRIRSGWECQLKEQCAGSFLSQFVSPPSTPFPDPIPRLSCAVS